MLGPYNGDDMRIIIIIIIIMKAGGGESGAEYVDCEQREYLA